MATWNDIIQASLNELSRLRLKFGQIGSFEEAYIHTLIAHLQGDVAELGRLESLLPVLVNELKIDSRELEFLRLAVALRKQICEQKVDRTFLPLILELAQKDPERRGELLFIAAMASEALKDDLKAKEYFRQAHLALEAGGAKGKAMDALLRYVTAEARIHANKRLFYDYQLVYQKACEAGLSGAAGTALFQISREYQKLGAWVASLNYCNHSITLLEREGESQSYFMAIAHRCHLLLQLGYLSEAQLDYDRARASSFPDVQELLKSIDELKQSGTFANPTHHPLASRRSTAKKLSPMEEKLVQLLAQAPLDKFEIISQLYGSDANILAAENRLNNLFSRIKKKHPGLIVRWEGKYSIANDVLLNASTTR